MAERRMFSKAIVESDVFLEMPLSAQALYFHLAMNADDEGFVGNPKRTIRMLGASEDDFKLLIVKRFLLTWESGIVVIKHWKINNYIQSDRFRPTTYIEERATLGIDEKKAYTERKSALDTQCIQPVSKLDTQYSIGENSIGKLSIGEGKSAHAREEPTPDTASAEDLEDLFLEKGFSIQIDCSPIFNLTKYDNILWALEASRFGRSVVRTLSFLHKKADVILSGSWTDFHKAVNENTIMNEVIEHWGEVTK